MKRAAVVLASVLLLPLGRTAAGEEFVGEEVPPGSIVRWPGAQIDACGMDGRRWPPLQGQCWYPIDLLRPAGSVTLERWRGGRGERARIRVSPYPYPVQEITIADQGKVDLSTADLERARAEQRRVAALWATESPTRFRLPLHPPLAPFPAGGRFGVRRVFNRQPRSPHSGADYAAPEGEPVFAAADGTVLLAEEHFFAGNSLFVDHGDGLITMYFHLSRILVEEGEGVERGQLVGRVGQTGRATGPHLHFGARWRGARIDPSLLFGSPEAVPALPAAP